MDTSSKSEASAKIVTALIVGLLVGFGAGAFWQERRLSNELPSEGIATAGEEMVSEKGGKKQVASAAASRQTQAGAATSTAMITVLDQPAGNAVRAERVVTGESVWVAVREEKNGGLGNILGVQKIPAGENLSVTVELLRPTKAGATYFVVLHTDVGDPAFNYREDVLIGGVQATFQAK